MIRPWRGKRPPQTKQQPGQALAEAGLAAGLGRGRSWASGGHETGKTKGRRRPAGVVSGNGHQDRGNINQATYAGRVKSTYEPHQCGSDASSYAGRGYTLRIKPWHPPWYIAGYEPRLAVHLSGRCGNMCRRSEPTKPAGEYSKCSKRAIGLRQP